MATVSYLCSNIFLERIISLGKKMNKKAAVLISGIGNDICSPFFDDSGKLNIVYQNSGSIKKINSVGNTQNVCNTNGHPSGACYGSDGN